MTWLQYFNRHTKRRGTTSRGITKAWKKPNLKERRYQDVRNSDSNGSNRLIKGVNTMNDESDVEHGVSTPGNNTISWNGLSSSCTSLKKHIEPMEISSPSPKRSYNTNNVRTKNASSHTSGGNIITPNNCIMNGDKHKENNNARKIAIDMLTLKAMQTEFFDLDHHHKSVHDIALALADSDVVMHLHAQNSNRSSTLNSNKSFSSVNLHEEKEAAREHRIKMCEKALKDSLMRVSSNVTIIEDWREFEKLLEDILVLPNEDDNDINEEAKGEMKDDVMQVSAQQQSMAYGGRKEEYLDALTNVVQKRGIVGPHEKWRQVVIPEAHQSMLDQRINDAHNYLLERNQAMEDEVEALMKRKEEEAAKAMMDKLLRPLELGEKERVNNALYGIGPQHDEIAEMDNDTVTRQSVQRLRPGAWLNDEIIHFYFSALSRRDAELNANNKRCHFFKSFFLTKLLEEQNGYKYQNVKRWSKKVPGKDIFALDKIFFPVNIGNMHWATSVIFLQEKCIRFYDSMGGNGTRYLEGLFRYLKDEWRDKKKTDRGDWDEWQLIGYTEDIPQQHNGFDCGVFTCMFADALSRGMPLCFTQQHITPFREHITLSILNGKAL